MRQFEILKGRPQGFAADHLFVIISADERCRENRMLQVNGLPCFTLRGSPGPRDVVLDTADGFSASTVCPCDLLLILDKAGLHSSLGLVSWERQQQIKAKIKSLLRF
jgi:hypothetical protein